MKLLLSSGGITNDTLARELENLAGKPFSELKIGFIPSAAFGATSDDKNWLIDDMSRLRARGATVAILSLADLTVDEIAEQLAAVDVVLIGGGQTFYLSWLMQQKGLFELLPRLLESKICAGISAGSMIMTQSLRSTSDVIRQPDISDDEMEKLGPVNRSSAKTLGLVPFLIRPHMNGDTKHADISLEMMQQAADTTGFEMYAIDDNCAVRVLGGEATVVGEGEWRLITPEAKQ